MKLAKQILRFFEVTDRGRGPPEANRETFLLIAGLRAVFRTGFDRDRCPG